MDFASKELFVKLKDKDSKAFELFYQQSVDIFFRYIMGHYSYLKKEDAQDILSDFYVKVWKSIDTVSSYTTFKSWLFTVLNNGVKDFLKRKKEVSFSSLKKVDSEGWEQSFEVAGNEKEALEILNEDFQREDIKTALSQLPQNYQVVLFLKYVEGKTNGEISEMLNISLDNVRQRASRGLKMLKKLLKK